MIQSMTGYGSAETSNENFNVKAEIKSLNSKFLDASIKLPKDLINKELELKSILEETLKRGKITLSLDIELKNYENAPVEINKPLFKKYYHEFNELAEEIGAKNEDIFKFALYSPNVIISKEELNVSGDWVIIVETVKSAISKCLEFRMNEGSKLEGHFKSYINQIENGLKNIEMRDPERAKSIKSRLSKSLSEISESVQVDENRFEQELIYYLEKIDITEEKVRLKSHLDYFNQILSDGDSQGKKLSFLAQEIGREINTIGSKANDADIQREVVDMKESLEKIKEQVLNVV